MVKIFFNLFFVVLSLGGNVGGASTKCEKTVTTATFNGLKKSPSEKKVCSGELIFEETFDSFDLDVWDHSNTLNGDREWEFQFYTNNRSNSFVEDGNLNIRPTLTADDFGELFLHTGTLDLHGGALNEQCTDAANSGCRRTGSQMNVLNPIKSARLRTLNSFAFKYGKVEINAKMPSGDWLLPSIKLLPKINAYGMFPASGEIDLVQSRGNRELTRNGVNIGSDQITSSLHFGSYLKADAWQLTSFPRNSNEKGKGFNAAFHRYQFEWATDKITFSIDDIETATVKAKSGFWDKGDFDASLPGTSNPWTGGSKLAPFDQEFYLSINLAVGGNEFFPDDAINSSGEKPWSNNSINPMTDFWHARNAWLPTWKIAENRTKDASLLIDYIRVWAL